RLVSLERGFHIPPKPELLSQIADEMQKSDASLDKIAQLISRDISLSALLLKTINSPVFAFHRQFGSIVQVLVEYENRVQAKLGVVHLS
ncbi:MAG: HDOD domain-containing protein, partial [Pseudomonadota bacterium]